MSLEDLGCRVGETGGREGWAQGALPPEMLMMEPGRHSLPAVEGEWRWSPRVEGREGRGFNYPSL